MAVDALTKRAIPSAEEPGHAPRLTAVVLTLNEEAHITDCLRSLEWADERLVFDSYSSDGTVPAAMSAGANVQQSRFENYAQQRNAALAAVDTEWVFFVDADERGTPELAVEIRHVIAERQEAAWYVPRHNYIFGKLTVGAGWYPDYQLRLFRQGLVRYERPVHEIAVVQGETGHLENPLIHYNYRNKAHFHTTQDAYSSYDAQILFDAGEPIRPHNYLLQPWRQFWWRYISLKGYADGGHGLWLSANMAYYEWIKFRKLARLRRQAGEKENEG
ncbi:MAG: glycosyltransferase family 2 protein [Candidatus Promineifilaceae bacterium]